MAVFAVGIMLVGLFANGWYALSRGTTDIDKGTLLSLGIVLEGAMFFILTEPLGS